MSDDNVIDVEVVELVDTPNLPAVLEVPDTHGAVPPIEGRDWSTYSRPERRCTANSSRTGEQCKNVAIKGSNVCRYHGGAAKQVKQAARIRLENAADLMAKQLLGIALTADSEGVKLAAIRDALDRAGLKAPSEVVVSAGEAKPYETVFDAIGGSPSDESRYPTSSYGSAGLDATPASAYGGYGDGGQAEAGSGESSYADTRYDEDHRPADENVQPSSPPFPPRQGSPRERDRDRQHQPPERHITGEAAMRLANEANRRVGALPPLRELESPHRRYRRP